MRIDFTIPMGPVRGRQIVLCRENDWWVIRDDHHLYIALSTSGRWILSIGRDYYSCRFSTREAAEQVLLEWALVGED